MTKPIDPQVQIILNSLTPLNHDQLGQNEMTRAISLTRSYEVAKRFSLAQLQETDVILMSINKDLGNISLALEFWTTTGLDPLLCISVTERIDRLNRFIIGIQFFRQFMLKPK